MVSSDFAQIMSLHAGEAYAVQNLTRTDRLGLLLSGKVSHIYFYVVVYIYNIKVNIKFYNPTNPMRSSCLLPEKAGNVFRTCDYIKLNLIVLLPCNI